MDGGALSRDLDVPPPSGLDARLAVLTTLPPDQLERLLADDAARAAPWVHAAAEAGLPEGQVRWGRMLLEGAGVAKDQAAALDWFHRAAQIGDADGQNMVGRCFENGWGVPAHPREAAHWFALAAAQGHAWAQYNLGHLHLDGLGLPRDPDRAFALYREAAEAGHVRAMNLVARCYEEGWGVEANSGLALYWFRRSAEGGYFRSQYNLATLLVEEGRTVEALGWFQQALVAAPAASRLVMARQLAGSPRSEIQAFGQEALNTMAASDRKLARCC